ncbi:MAG: putative toxin-antitoxin system toxin component, PIN family [Clostridia bacterium]|nr:putative toxin-antitoxin system toxin component, PIN family [Clostridia bacterium]
MRVMLDTNVLLSVLLFPGKRMNRMMQCIFEEHRLVLSSFVLEELAYVVERKFPTKAGAVDALLSAMSYELVYTPKEMDRSLFEIRDGKDYPVLYTAMMEDVDVLITGDKDFAEVDVERPEILTPAEFCDRYVVWE